jgi:hypothetical protein
MTCAGSAGAQTPSASPPSPTASVLYLDADAAGAVLEVRETMVWKEKNQGWRPLCASPCAAPALAGYEFRATAPGKVASVPFAVGWPGPTSVQVSMGSKPARTTGIVLTSVGGAVGGIGLTFAALMAEGSSELGQSRDDAVLALAVGTLGAGVFVTGLYLMLSNRTSTTLSPGSAPQGFAFTPGGFVF